jgi:predicted ABC-type ATPase
VPTLIIVAEPNGAGKTSFANKHFETPRVNLYYVSADEIARGLVTARLSQGERDIRAGREMLGQIDALVDAGASFMFETTLASLSYARKIPAWRRRGYRAALIHLRLSTVEMSIERIRRRVAQGGHDVPERVIRQRFAKSADYLGKYYKPIVDEWYIWDSLEGEFRHAESWND